MDFIIAASTDVGIKKTTNQDSLSIKVINTVQGKMTFAVLCDGVGGFKRGEIASASLVNAFNEWVMNDLPSLCNSPIEDYVIRAQWEGIIEKMNEKLVNYGKRNNIKTGTTVVAMLLTRDRYYIINVGDSRVYEITDRVSQMTNDQTWVAREVERGKMTQEEAQNDPRRNILLQCVGFSNKLYPEMRFGETKKNAVYFLSSDGFIHKISNEEIYENLKPEILTDEFTMQERIDLLIDVNKQRQEQDNISVALARTF